MKKAIGRRAKRGVTLVEVLIVVAIMAAIAGAVTLVAVPEANRSKVRLAAMGAGTIREAAVIWREIDTAGEARCPTIQDLVSAKKLDPQKSDDPWGSQFAIHCENDDVQVSSPGRDRRHGTPDDVRQGMKQAELEAVAKL